MNVKTLTAAIATAAVLIGAGTTAALLDQGSSTSPGAVVQVVPVTSAPPAPVSPAPVNVTPPVVTPAPVVVPKPKPAPVVPPAPKPKPVVKTVTVTDPITGKTVTLKPGQEVAVREADKPVAPGGPPTPGWAKFYTNVNGKLKYEGETSFLVQPADVPFVAVNS